MHISGPKRVLPMKHNEIWRYFLPFSLKINFCAEKCILSKMSGFLENDGILVKMMIFSEIVHFHAVGLKNTNYSIGLTRYSAMLPKR